MTSHVMKAKEIGSNLLVTTALPENFMERWFALE